MITGVFTGQTLTILSERRMREAGFEQIQCQVCQGTGVDQAAGRPCYNCDGDGTLWKLPNEKLRISDSKIKKEIELKCVTI